MSKFILIIDYNLSRYDDVMHISRYAKSQYNLETILVRHQPNENDLKITKHIINQNPRADDFVSQVLNDLGEYQGSILSALTFSDDAVYKGAKIIESIGLKTDSSNLALHAFSKISYRDFESKNAAWLKPQGLWIPESKTVSSFEEVEAFAKKHPNFVIKPAIEGNNRGVIKVTSDMDLVSVFSEVRHYVYDGLICEELISFPNEASFDGIGDFSFVTKKISLSSSKYPVEMGQIVYGNQLSSEVQLIKNAGRLGNLLVGQKRGPFHNEVKYDAERSLAAIVEPNRRPAGMKIWDLAARVFGFNLYEFWVDSLMLRDASRVIQKNDKAAAIFQLRAPVSGYLPQSTEIIQRALALTVFEASKYGRGSSIEWFGARVIAQPGSWIDIHPKDNSGFLAQICCEVDNASKISVEHLCYQFERLFHKNLESLNVSESILKTVEVNHENSNIA